MSLFTEIYGTNLDGLTLDMIKDLIKSSPFANAKHKRAMLMEFGILKPVTLTDEDYKFIES